jgi:hypothetical protein
MILTYYFNSLLKYSSNCTLSILRITSNKLNKISKKFACKQIIKLAKLFDIIEYDKNALLKYKSNVYKNTVNVYKSIVNLYIKTMN